jgi:hypothetical protein
VPVLPDTQTIQQMMPGDVDPSDCAPWVPPVTLTGVISAIACDDDSLPGGTIFGVQLNTPANYATSLAAFNNWLGFDSGDAQDNCPPAGTGAYAQGQGTWSDDLYPTLNGQNIECLFVGAVGSDVYDTPDMTYLYPNQDAFIDAQGAADQSMSSMYAWWVDNAAPDS